VLGTIRIRKANLAVMVINVEHSEADTNTENKESGGGLAYLTLSSDIMAMS